MAKRIMLFLFTNVLVMATVSIIVNLLGVNHYLTAYGLNWVALAIFCGVWGMAGAFVSLGMSRFVAKHAMGVQVLDPNSGHPLILMVAGLCQRAGLPMPEVGIYNSPEMNAFATGPSKRRSLVAVSSGLLNSMNKNELEGVLAHELSHISGCTRWRSPSANGSASPCCCSPVSASSCRAWRRRPPPATRVTRRPSRPSGAPSRRC